MTDLQHDRRAEDRTQSVSDDTALDAWIDDELDEFLDREMASLREALPDFRSL